MGNESNFINNKQVIKNPGYVIKDKSDELRLPSDNALFLTNSRTGEILYFDFLVR